MVNNWLILKQFRRSISSCLLCGKGSSFDLGICRACYRELPWLKNGCPRCSRPISNAGFECGECQASPPPFRSAHSLFCYSYPIDKLVPAFKFKAQLHIGRFFAEVLAHKIMRYYPKGGYPAAIVPVPLHWTRAQERGFNQAHYLARIIGKRTGLPVCSNLCRRIRATTQQLGLSGVERRKNLRRAFKVAGAAPPAHLILVDDVMTTGTTLAELSQTLRAAGTEQIDLWCIARV